MLQCYKSKQLFYRNLFSILTNNKYSKYVLKPTIITLECLYFKRHIINQQCFFLVKGNLVLFLLQLVLLYPLSFLSVESRRYCISLTFISKYICEVKGLFIKSLLRMNEFIVCFFQQFVIFVIEKMLK